MHIQLKKTFQVAFSTNLLFPSIKKKKIKSKQFYGQKGGEQ